MLTSYVFGFVSQGLYFVITARTLGAKEFGLFAGAIALVAVLASLVGLGGGNVLVLKAARDPSLLRIQFGTSVVYILATAVPLSLVAIAVGWFSGPDFLAVLLPLVVSEIFTLRLFDLAQQIFQAREELGRTSACGILAGALRLTIAAVYYLIASSPSASQWSFCYAATTIATAGVVVGWAVIRAGKPVFEWASIRSTWRTGVFFSLGTASRTLYMDADKFLLTSYGLYSASGAFSATTKITTMAFAPIQAIVYSLNTRLFRAGHMGARRSWSVIQWPLGFVLLYGILCACVLAFASPLVPIILGTSYSETSGFLGLIAPIIALNGVHYLLGDALMGLGKQAARSLVQFGVACAAILMNLILIPLIGPISAVFSALTCSLVLALAMTIMFFQAYKSDRSPRHLATKVKDGFSSHA
nr:oligosaccharide flippase family protein [Pseudarthrobacter sp. C4D7]